MLVLGKKNVELIKVSCCFFRMNNTALNPHLRQTNVSGCRFYPILFSTSMVEAILAGKKTQTRRVFKINKTPITHPQENVFWDIEMRKAVYNSLGGQSWWNCPYGNMGDVLWLRETWQETTWLHPSNDEYGYIYKASENGREWAANYENWTWKPSLFMPKSACRLFLEITDIKVERLKDISADDIKREGVSYGQPQKTTTVNKLTNRHRQENATAQMAHLVFSDTRANAQKTKRAIFCQGTDRQTDIKK
jgi:hypothetical protein